MYSRSSPYFSTELNQNYLDVLTLNNLPSFRDDTIFEITKTYENRPDLLAYDLYNDSNLWWVFSIRNKSILKDPVFDFTSGKKIYLPKLSTLKDFLGI